MTDSERTSDVESADSVSPRRRNHAIWLGPLVTLAGFISYFTYFIRFAELRDFPWLNLPLVLIGLAVSILGVSRAFVRAAVYRGKIVGSLGFLFSLAIALFFNAYIFYISYDLPEVSSVTTDLTIAPDFELPDHNGQTVRLADFRGRKVVLNFYRGHW